MNWQLHNSEYQVYYSRQLYPKHQSSILGGLLSSESNNALQTPKWVPPLASHCIHTYVVAMHLHSYLSMLDYYKHSHFQRENELKFCAKSIIASWRDDLATIFPWWGNMKNISKDPWMHRHDIIFVFLIYNYCTRNSSYLSKSYNKYKWLNVSLFCCEWLLFL